MEMYDYIRYSHHKLGHGIRKISRDTGLDRKTIRRALKGQKPEYQLKNPRSKGVIGQFMDQCQFHSNSPHIFYSLGEEREKTIQKPLAFLKM